MQTMENENNNLQGRRMFFKEAAKKALPILGAVLLLNNSSMANILKSEVFDCDSASCEAACAKSCGGSCSGCSGSCKGTCSGGCSDGCKKSEKLY